MSIEEAIKILDEFRKIQVIGLKEARHEDVRQIRQENLEAFTMAIAALRKVKEE